MSIVEGIEVIRERIEQVRKADELFDQLNNTVWLRDNTWDVMMDDYYDNHKGELDGLILTHRGEDAMHDAYNVWSDYYKEVDNLLQALEESRG